MARMYKNSWLLVLGIIAVFSIALLEKSAISQVDTSPDPSDLKNLTVRNNLTVQNNATLGNASGDTHTITGAVNMTGDLTVTGAISGTTTGGGATTLTGTLTMDGVTTDITTDTNEDLTLAPNGTGDIILSNEVTSTMVNAAGGSADAIEIYGTNGIMDGSDTYRGLYYNVTNANHTGSSNAVNAINIGSITPDADAVERGILIEPGWDTGIVTQVGNGTDLSGNELQLSPALTAMDGNDTWRGLWVTPTNANHAGASNFVYGISVASITDDSNASEYGIIVADGWDRGIHVNASNSAAGDDATDLSGTGVQVGGALTAMDGSDTWRGLYIAPTNANHTGSGNTLYGMHIGNITGDAEAAEYGILVGTGWDNGIITYTDVLVIDDVEVWYGSDNNFGLRYDETTDDRLELVDGGDNLMMAVTDTGNEASMTLTGAITLGNANVTCSSDACTDDANRSVMFVTTESAGGADVMTIADGQAAGEWRTIVLKTDGGDELHVSPTTLASGSYIALDDAMDAVQLLFDGTSWHVVSNQGGTIN